MAAATALVTWTFRGAGSATPRVTPSVLATVLNSSPAASAASGEATPTGGHVTGTPRGSLSPAVTGSATGSGAKAAAAALVRCRAAVQAADRVVAAATTGIGHWTGHVQAQADHDRGSIGYATMKKRFKATKKHGPADIRRYSSAVARNRTAPDCRAVPGAEAAVATALATCARRAAAQPAALEAGARGMADWTSHLAAMRRSASGHVHDAQGVWLRAYAAAPRNITGFRQALQTYRGAPDC